MLKILKAKKRQIVSFNTFCTLNTCYSNMLKHFSGQLFFALFQHEQKQDLFNLENSNNKTKNKVYIVLPIRHGINTRDSHIFIFAQFYSAGIKASIVRRIPKDYPNRYNLCAGGNFLDFYLILYHSEL